MSSVGLLTTIGPNMNLDWFRLAARSVRTPTTDIHWLIAAPHQIVQKVKDVLWSEGLNRHVQFDVFTRHTGNVAQVRNFLATQTDAEYVMQFDCDDILCGSGLDEMVFETDVTGRVWGASPITDFNERISPVHDVPDIEEMKFPGTTVPKKKIFQTRRKLRSITPMGIGVIHPGSCIFNREMFLLLGGQDEWLGNLWEDYIPLMLFSMAYDGAWSSIPTLIYRKHDNSLIAAEVSPESEKWYDEYLCSIEDMAEEIVDRGGPLQDMNISALRKRLT